MPKSDSPSHRLHLAHVNLNSDIMQRDWHVALRYRQDTDEVEEDELHEVSLLACSPDYVRDEHDEVHVVVNVLQRSNDGEISLVEQLWECDEMAAFCIRVLTMLKADDRLDAAPSWIQTLLDGEDEDPDGDDDDEDGDDDDEDDEDDDDDDGGDDDDEDDDGDDAEVDEEEGEEGQARKPPLRRSARRKPPVDPNDPEEVFDQGGDDDFDDTEEDDAEEDDDD